MIIELKGVNFVNKGAELMLHAIMDKVSSKIKDAEFVVIPRHNDYIHRAKLGLYQKVAFKKYGINFGTLGEYIPNKLKKMYGLVSDSETEVVLDASGFAYSDQWGPQKTISMAKDIAHWKKQGKKVVLLPQAFGPFENNQIIKEKFKIIANKADLIYPRERASYEHIVKLTGESSHIKTAPDFTNLLEGRLPDYFDPDYQACIIPNYRMIDKTSAAISNRYEDLLVYFYNLLEGVGIKPFILIHETDKDYELALNMQKLLNKKITILKETDPIYIKGIIGNSHLVISSRFHGIVSSLSQGIPALGTGWSHKYHMLFDDYCCPELLISPNDDFDIIKNKLYLVIEKSSKEKLIKKLKENSLRQISLTNQMWNEVFSLITQKRIVS